MSRDNLEYNAYTHFVTRDIGAIKTEKRNASTEVDNFSSARRLPYYPENTFVMFPDKA